jgi:glycosyltransferase involved in cell wall biosynthesis
VVAASVGGVPEIATVQKTALLTEARNPEALAAAMQRILEDSQLRARLAANALALVESSYSPEAYRRSLVGIYQRVLQARSEAA